MNSPLTLLLFLSSLALILGLLWVLKRKVKSDFSLITLLISLPQKESQDPQEFLREIAQFEQMMSALSSIKEPMALEMAVRATGEEIYFYLAIPRVHKDFTARQIQGFFPEANVKLVPDYTIFSGQENYESGWLKLNQTHMLPIRTYKESEVDSFASLISTFSRLRAEGEGASLQVVFQSDESGYSQKIKSAITELKSGEKFKTAVKKAEASLGQMFINEISSLFQSSKDEDMSKPKDVEQNMVEALEKKINKPLFSVNVRLVTAAGSKQEADDILLSTAGAFAQFATPLRNDFKIIRPRKNKKLITEYIFRDFNPKEIILLNTEELASLFHFPTTATNIPRISWQKTKEAPPPQNVPSEGTLIGQSVFRGDVKPIYLTDEDRRRHFYIIGQTGTGKSFFMLNQIVQDMKNGNGLCVVDPHGELVDAVLERVPADRIEDVIVFDPGDTTRPLGLNMLEFDPAKPEEKTFIVNEIQSIFNRLFSEETMGPMFEQYMRNALLLLMEDSKHEPATLMEVPRIFTDESFRERKLARISNPAVIDFWEKEAAKTTGEQGLNNIAPYITSKFGNFIANDYMRPIIGQTKSAFNFREVMDHKKILLVSLSKGKIGDINSGLLGMITTSRLLLAALSRTDIPEAERQDFYLYIDEFQNFTTDSISVILSEARKYHLNLILAHQFISQLTDDIRESVFGNVGSLTAFRVGATDAEPLLKQFSPVFTENDLINVENQHAHAKLLFQGEPSKPFSLEAVKVSNGLADLKNQLKELSRLTYGREISEIEQDILRRLRG